MGLTLNEDNTRLNAYSGGGELGRLRAMNLLGSRQECSSKTAVLSTGVCKIFVKSVYMDLFKMGSMHDWTVYETFA